MTYNNIVPVKFNPPPPPNPYEKKNYIMFHEKNFKSTSTIKSNIRHHSNYEKFKQDYGI